jgi:hypothetical protein
MEKEAINKSQIALQLAALLIGLGLVLLGLLSLLDHFW